MQSPECCPSPLGSGAPSAAREALPSALESFHLWEEFSGAEEETAALGRDRSQGETAKVSSYNNLPILTENSRQRGSGSQLKSTHVPTLLGEISAKQNKDPPSAEQFEHVLKAQLSPVCCWIESVLSQERSDVPDVPSLPSLIPAEHRAWLTAEICAAWWHGKL